MRALQRSCNNGQSGAAVRSVPAIVTKDAMPTRFPTIESPGHPRLDALYQRLGIAQVKLASQRKAL